MRAISFGCTEPPTMPVGSAATSERAESSLFAAEGWWEDPGTPGIYRDDIWHDGNYHLKSQCGRFVPPNNWDTDSATSPCIDAGDPTSEYINEQQPNGGRINIGRYGNTREASSSTNITWPIAGDCNGDCHTNVLDLIYIRNRLNSDPTKVENRKAEVNGDAKINILDLIYVRTRLNLICR
ncbi:MAG TPA: dockerin type I domain-containing protein [Acidobacteriota bacterium]|nr:dockerin type I domain-containing protein [Acidobacteriota bacterium]